MSHDPAIRVARWENHGRDDAIAATLDPASREDLAEHEHCDFLIGRCSGGLVEIGCPPRTGLVFSGHPSYARHNATQWIDVKWLRLLYAAVHVYPIGEHLASAAKGITDRGCWTPDRLRRLRIELGFEIPAAWKGEDVA
jgi:hypothetical protein